MQHTSKYQFKLIEGTDDFSPGPLNDNMEMVEEQFEAVEEEFSEVMTNLGSGGNTARIIYGSYVGTGTYGAGNPNTLTFDFRPLLLIWGDPVYDQYTTVVCMRGRDNQPGPNGRIATIWGNNSVSWYHSSSAQEQANSDGITYHYVAIGDNMT